MKYSGLRTRFALEAAIGVVVLLGVFLLSQIDVSLVAFLFIWPFLLRRSREGETDHVKHIYRDTFRIALGLTAVFLLATFVAIDSGIVPSQSRFLLLLLMPPWFMVSHGLGGYFIVSSRQGASTPS